MLTIKRITDYTSSDFKSVNELYESAFPHHEKRHPVAKINVLTNPNYSLQAWFDGEQFVGMIGAWDFNDYAYIEHLAVSSQVRSQGYGKQMLSQFLQLYPQTILEIDPLTSGIAHNRLRFYQSLGFSNNNYLHLHPTYHRGIPDHQLIVLSYPQPIDEARYQRFFSDLCRVVMAGAF
ncbi:GNAT family N-acetyltransferase [Pantoea agglomerans]|nr:GNAT family N-acetyltransferase [Pantoea agglomerans]PEI02175.1 GNAT family N-acetyltransferase [Pantoea agglomerans]